MCSQSGFSLIFITSQSTSLKPISRPVNRALWAEPNMSKLGSHKRLRASVRARAYILSSQLCKPGSQFNQELRADFGLDLLNWIQAFQSGPSSNSKTIQLHMLTNAVMQIRLSYKSIKMKHWSVFYCNAMKVHYLEIG